MAGSTKKKATKRRRWGIPKLLMLFAIGGLCGILAAIFIMQQELDRIGFFNKGKRLPLPLPQALQKEAPNTTPSTSPTSMSAPSPATSASVTARSIPPVATESSTAEDRKRADSSPPAPPPEKLSQDDRKSLEDILRKHPQ
jgi:hypothetical protein